MSHQPFEHPELFSEDLVSHTFLDYINGILMDESPESYSSSQLRTIQSNHAYQLIFNGFHDILMNDREPNVHLSSLLSTGCAPLPFHDAVSGAHTDTDGFNVNRGSSISKHAMVDTDMYRGVFSGPNAVFTQPAAGDQQLAYHRIMKGLLRNTSDGCVSTDAFSSSSHVLVDSGMQPLPFDDSNTCGQSLKRAQSLGTAQDDISFVMNADLAAEEHAQLFDEWRGRGRNEANLQEQGRAHVKGRDDVALVSPVNLKTLLLSSGKALGEGDTRKAMELLQQVRQQGASPHGTGLQRVGHYFSEAMMARLSGMGSTLYAAIASTTQLPPAWMTLKAFKMIFEVCPYLKTAHYFANQYILKALNGASRLHIVDYGIFYGFQWPCLIYALAQRTGGPPFVRITGIELPTKPTDVNPSSTIEGTGRRLAEYAKTYNVPFEYHAVSANNWEDIEPASLRISPDEVLVLNSFNRLRHIHDEGVSASLSARDRLFQQMRSLNPRLLVTGFMNASHSSPFFVPRFREALHYYCNKFDTLHTIVYEDSPERLMFEREVMGRAILNVVACEGIQRVERPEMYKQWQVRIRRAGFRQRPLLPSVVSTAETIMKSYHKDFSLLQESNKWILLGWRGRVMQSLSAWEPATMSCDG